MVRIVDLKLCCLSVALASCHAVFPYHASQNERYDASAVDADGAPAPKDSSSETNPADSLGADVTLPPLCDTTFGAVPGYMFCDVVQAERVCIFYRNTKPAAGVSCAKICADQGASCIAAYQDDTETCNAAGLSTCAYEHGDSICHCRLPAP